MVEGRSKKEEARAGDEHPPSMTAGQFEARPEFLHFKNVMRRVLAVSKDELDRMVHTAKRSSSRAGNPNAPGRKPVKKSRRRI